MNVKAQVARSPLSWTIVPPGPVFVKLAGTNTINLNYKKQALYMPWAIFFCKIISCDHSKK